MSNIMNDLHAVGLNPFGVALVAESLLKSPLAQMTVGKPQGFFFPVKRSDCHGWIGARFTLEAVPQAAENEAATTQQDDKPRGLYRKFDVYRTDGSSRPGAKHHNCEYFVLDLSHDKHAEAALRAYADSCAGEFPRLAADLRQKLEDAEAAGYAWTSTGSGSLQR